LVHRDVKPENILLDADRRAHLTDFGIARDADFLKRTGGSRTLAATGLPVGTPEYMAPEQLRGETVDHRVDIYSLGVVLYELLTGTPPFVASSPYEVASLVLAGALQPPSAHNPLIWPELDAVVMQALAAKPAARFQDTRAFAIALRNAVLHREGTRLGTSTRGPDAPTVPLDADAAQVETRRWLPQIPTWLAPARYFSPRRGRGVFIVASVLALVVLLACAGGALALLNGTSLLGGSNPFYRPPARGGVIVNSPSATTGDQPTATARPTASAIPTATPIPLPKPTLSISPRDPWMVTRPGKTCIGFGQSITNQSGFTINWQWLSPAPGNLKYSFGAPTFDRTSPPLPSRTNVASGQKDTLYVRYSCPNTHPISVQVRVTDAAHPQNTTTYTITLQPRQSGG
jgi:serine/threonine-protein kinase